MNRRRGQQPAWYRIIERLEERILLSGDDTLATATSVLLTPNVPTQLSDSIDPLGDRDLYKVTLAAGDTLTADIDAATLGSHLDSYLRLFKATGNTAVEVDNNDDDGSTTDSLLSYTAASAGTYYVGVSGTGTNPVYLPTIATDGTPGAPTIDGMGINQSIGAYSLTLLVKPVMDAGDTLSTADQVQLASNVQQPISGQIDPAGDVDLYRVNLAAADRLSLDIEPGTNSGTLNRLVRVFNSAGVEVTSNQSGATTNANLNFTADAAGSYFVGVSDLGNDNYNPNIAGSGNTADAATGDYLLNLKITPLGDVGDTLATAAPVSFLRDPSTHFGIQGGISRPLDVDLYSVKLVAGDSLHLSVQSDPANGAALGSARLRLFDSAGNEIDSAVSNPGNNVPALTEAITTPGTYYVGVSSADNSNYNPLIANSGTAGSTGDYQLVVVVNSASSVSAEVEPNNVIGRPNVIGANANVAGAIGSAGDADFYMFNVTAPGLFTAAVNADAGSPLNARLTLIGPDQTPWQTSDDQAAGNQNPLITANLVPGTYFLKIESSAPSGTSLGATGAYHLQTKLVAAASAFDGNTTGSFSPAAIVSGDFNGDHIPDLLVTHSNPSQGLSATVSLLLGLENMSYRPATSISVGQVPDAIATGDFNHDGKLDFATANGADGTVSILLGNGDGTFAPQKQISVGVDPQAIVAADFNNDQILDLAVALGSNGTVALLTGQGAAGVGNGTFVLEGGAVVGADPVGLIAVDLNHDNRPDLATANMQSNTVSVVLNDGNGGFLPAINYSVGAAPTSLTSADFNGDSIPDLAVADAGSSEVSLLFGGGNGTLRPGGTIEGHQGAAPPIPSGGIFFRSAVQAADFNHDGITDLIVTNSLDPYSVTVALGKTGSSDTANGSFEVSQFASNTSQPWDIAVGDFDNNGTMDVAITDNDPANSIVSVIAGLNDGTFRVVPRNLTGTLPMGVAVADLNHDGQPDLVTANADGASVLLGRGDGTFADQLTESIGHVNAVATGDFNQDNNTDLVTVGYTSDTSGTQTNEIVVLLGIGDGTYDALPPIVFSSFLSAVVVGDFNHDGLTDLAVTSKFGNSVTVLLANKDAAGHFSGTFTQQAPITVGLQPDAIVTGDFDHDGHTDLAVANFADGTVSLLLGNDQGLYAVQPALAVGESPTALAVGDFNNDGVDDVAVANSGSGRLSILFGAANRDFAKANFNSFSLPAGINPRGIVVADLNGDGLDDIAAANTTSNTVSVYLNLGNGTFAPQQQFNVATNSSSGSGPYAIVASDFNHDGHVDLATVNNLSQNVSILIGSADPNSDIILPPGPTGAGRRVPGVKFDASPLPQTSAVNTAPLLIDLNGDGTPDSVVMDAAGNVLLRLGRADVLGTFQSSQIVAANAASYATFQDGGQILLGVLDRDGVTLRLYRFAKDGTAVLVSTTNLQGQGSPIRYDRIIASQLNGDNDDLVAVSSAQHTVSMFLRSSTGFDVAGRKDVPVGDSPANIVAANSGANGAFELLVADQAFGTVNVVAGGFQTGATAIAYRASATPTGVQQLTSTPGAPGTPLVFDGAEAVATGDFNEDGIPDAIVVHRGTNSFSLLLGTSDGGLVNPVEFLAGSQPIAVQVADFNHDNHADLAVLNAGTHTVSIFLGDGHGHFTLKGNFDAGNAPTGLSVFDVTGDGNLDLMVGNSLGDVTTLPGNGDGTFQPFTRIDRSMSISVGDLDGDGKPDWVITDHTSDRLVVQNEQQAPGLTQTGSDGISAPAGVKVADLNGDGVPDMIVANSGSNQVLVYLGIKGANGKATGQFAPPMAFFAGTDPVDVEVADVAGFHVDAKTGKLVTGDGIMDLIVTNAGSNDLSIFKGTGDASLLDPKPLVISTGGSDPVSTQVGDFNGDQIPDLLVTNHDSNNVTMLSGSGFGFFSPTPTVYNTGRGPTETLVGNFDSRPGLDFATLNFFSNSLTFYSGFNVNSRTDMSSGGTNPVTAIAADFNNDGTLDLVVGNNGNGVFSVFEGSQAGLSLMNSFSDPSIDHPAALALAEFGQGQELQLLALGEGDELVHEFGRDTIVGPSNNNGNSTLLVSLSELGTSTISSLFGGTSTGLSAFASLAAALGVSVEGFFTQSSTTSFFEGSGAVVNRPFSLEIIDHLDSVITTGTLWLESTVQEFGSILGLDVDDKAITQTVEDVVSLLFPHLPLHALPSLIHNIIGKTNAKQSTTPLATDQAMENYDAEAWIGDANSEAEPGAELSLDNLDVDSTDTLSPGGTADRFAENWNIARRTDLADQLAGILASGGGATFDGSPMAWNTSPEPRAAAMNVPAQRPVGVPKIVTLYDGTKRFGRAVPKVLVPPMGAASNRPLPSAATPGVKSASSAHPQRHGALVAAAALGTLGAAGYVNHSRRREKSAGGSRG